VDVFDNVSLYTSPNSAAFNSGLTSPAYTYDLKGKDISINFLSSSDGVTYSTETVGIGGVLSATSNKQRFKYSVNFASGVAVSSFTSLTVTSFSSSTYVSSVKFTSDDISAFKLFSASSVDDDNLAAYSVRSDTYAFAADAAVPAWIAQTNNATVAASTNPYVQFMIDPTVITSTNALTVNSVGLSYSIGTQSPPAASVVADGRYIASVSHSSAFENDITYIWQKNKEWTFSDQGYGALGLYANKPMAGSTGTSSKLWYILDPLALTFDGTAISSSWTTKDFTFGNLNAHKVVQKLWLTAEGNGPSAFGIAWQANRDGVWNSTTTPLSGASFIIKEVEGLFENQYPARQIRFKFTSSELAKTFKMKLFSIYFRVNPLIKD
jgi:hypothetical protein